MKLQNPILLLYLWFFLPVETGGTINFFPIYILEPSSRFLAAQVVLTQIQSINIARRAEKQIDSAENNADPGLKELWVSFWTNPTTTAAYSYLGLLSPYAGLFNHPIVQIRHNIGSRKFEFSKHAADQLITQQISIHEVEEAIMQGDLIQDDSDDPDHPSYLINGLTQTNKSIYIKFSSQIQPVSQIIAVYETPASQESGTFQQGSQL